MIKKCIFVVDGWKRGGYISPPFTGDTVENALKRNARKASLPAL
jgi:hypothetical protein